MIQNITYFFYYVTNYLKCWEKRIRMKLCNIVNIKSIRQHHNCLLYRYIFINFFLNLMHFCHPIFKNIINPIALYCINYLDIPHDKLFIHYIGQDREYKTIIKGSLCNIPKSIEQISQKPKRKPILIKTKKIINYIKIDDYHIDPLIKNYIVHDEIILFKDIFVIHNIPHEDCHVSFSLIENFEEKNYIEHVNIFSTKNIHNFLD